MSPLVWVGAVIAVGSWAAGVWLWASVLKRCCSMNGDLFREVRRLTNLLIARSRGEWVAIESAVESDPAGAEEKAARRPEQAD